VFITLVRLNSYRVKTLMLNLCVDDMLVICVMMPMEMVRRLRSAWVPLHGWFGCRFIHTLRVFGPYLSSMVLICISLDRYFVITKSVRAHNNRFRFKSFLVAAWAVSFAFALPQSIVTQLDGIAGCPQVVKCESRKYFAEQWSSISYNLMKLAIMYFLPLTVIIFCYFYICSHVIRHSNELRRYSIDAISTISATTTINGSSVRSTSSSLVSQFSTSLTYSQAAATRVQRSKRQTIKMTLIIVFAFVFCWTPYAVVELIAIVLPSIHDQMDPYVKDFVLLVALANSCVNPIIYGSHVNLLKSAYRRYRRRS